MGRLLASLESLQRTNAKRSAYVHTLTLRLTADQYRQLRHFVLACEDQLGQRLTHQSLLETALVNYMRTTEDDLANQMAGHGREFADALPDRPLA